MLHCFHLSDPKLGGLPGQLRLKLSRSQLNEDH